MNDHPYRWPLSQQGTRRPSFDPPRVDTNNLGHNEFMWPVSVMVAHGDQAYLQALFSGDWPDAFIHAKFVEDARLPTDEYVRPYQTPMGHIICTRAIKALVRPEGLVDFETILLPILEEEVYPYDNMAIIMGQPQVEFFMGPDWPGIEPLQPLPRPDFSSPRHSLTFPGAPAMYGPTMTGDFHNNTLLPAWPSYPAYTPNQTQVNFSQVGGHYTFASAAMAGGLSREDQTRMWVDNYYNGNTGSGSNENGVDDSGNNVPSWGGELRGRWRLGRMETSESRLRAFVVWMNLERQIQIGVSAH
ncbi:predicted protein [Chaetomium globosum CBS 148.51]|uniref:Uncharacterized protein n=1 Tax=Chaetomium globosum (strain ATCC 6205 / CBS 148.51 / DSM 1962 / NBRC 6347 / NRRL 1970) TaxID=306901 RepID=Q2GS50_CHAGB|nr:uncharacterized protein CHGG_09204 [Chaetomium globosum CBS 148.51]EAQ85190.1 predicted protein [Chaetomium globosum CBS 148.51]